VTLLIAVAVLYGALAAFLFRRMTSPSKLHLAINRILAHIIEFRLFIDEPALIWKAQKAAFRANLSLLRQIALPVLLTAIPLVLAWQPLEQRFGHAPLKIGETTLMTARTDDVPCMSGLLVETPGVHIVRTGEIVWRVRLVKELKGGLPPGVELRYPRSNIWVGWFLAVSSLSAVVFAKTI
jgi:hypothetical protein